MKTTSEIFDFIAKECRNIAINVFCTCIPVDCIYCGIEDYMCPKHLYFICCEAIERGY